MDLSTKQGRREQGALIQKAVERAGLSVEELAARIGCSRALIYQYLSGATLAQPDRLQQIAAVAGVPLTFFFGSEAPDDSRRIRRERESAGARLTDTIRQLEELAHAQSSPPDWNALASTCDRIVSLAAQADDASAEARALLMLGQARLRMGEFSRAVDPFSRAATLFATLADERNEAESRQGLGHAFLSTGRIDEARDQFMWVAKSPRWEEKWKGVVSLAAVDEQLGDYRRAMERCDEAAGLIEEGRDADGVARGMLYVNANRVNLFLACGDFKSAAPLAERCLLEAESLGNGDQHLEARLNLAICNLYQGRWAAAHRLLSWGLPLARFVGDKSREHMVRAVFGLLLSNIGDYEAATKQAKDSLAGALAEGDHRTELWAQMALADVYCRTARLSEARYHANQALAVASALRLQLYQADCRLRMAVLALLDNDLVEATDQADRALAGAAQLGARHVEAHARVLRADLKLRAKSVDEANVELQTGLAIARDIGIAPVEWQAEALRSRIACAYSSPHETESEEAATRAVELIEGVRAEMRDAGIPDTLLEDSERQTIYLERAKLLLDAGKTTEAEAFIQQAEWPPLQIRFIALARGFSAGVP